MRGRRHRTGGYKRLSSQQQWPWPWPWQWQWQWKWKWHDRVSCARGACMSRGTAASARGLAIILTMSLTLLPGFPCLGVSRVYVPNGSPSVARSRPRVTAYIVCSLCSRCSNRSLRLATAHRRADWMVCAARNGALTAPSSCVWGANTSGETGQR